MSTRGTQWSWPFFLRGGMVLFAALSAVLIALAGCQSGNGTPRSTSPTIVGSIRVEGGEGIAGVTISANHGGSTAVTDPAGHYIIHVPSNWSGVIQPQHVGYHFDPPHRSYTKLSHAIEDQDYSAQRIAHPVSPRAEHIVISDIPSRQPSITPPPDRKAERRKEPKAKRPEQNAPSDPAQAADGVRCISGFIRDQRGTPEVGIVVSANNGGGTAMSDREGHYKIRVPAKWSGVVVAQHKEYVFNPRQRTFSLLPADVANVDFTAMHEPVTISGMIRTHAGNGLA